MQYISSYMSKNVFKNSSTLSVTTNTINTMILFNIAFGG